MVSGCLQNTFLPNGFQLSKQARSFGCILWQFHDDSISDNFINKRMAFRAKSSTTNLIDFVKTNFPNLSISVLTNQNT